MCVSAWDTPAALQPPTSTTTDDNFALFWELAIKRMPQQALSDVHVCVCGNLLSPVPLILHASALLNATAIFTISSNHFPYVHTYEHTYILATKEVQSAKWKFYRILLKAGREILNRIPKWQKCVTGESAAFNVKWLSICLIVVLWPRCSAPSTGDCLQRAANQIRNTYIASGHK